MLGNTKIEFFFFSETINYLFFLNQYCSFMYRFENTFACVHHLYSEKRETGCLENVILNLSRSLSFYVVDLFPPLFFFLFYLAIFGVSFIHHSVL